MTAVKSIIVRYEYSAPYLYSISSPGITQWVSPGVLRKYGARSILALFQLNSVHNGVFNYPQSKLLNSRAYSHRDFCLPSALGLWHCLFPLVTCYGEHNGTASGISYHCGSVRTCQHGIVGQISYIVCIMSKLRFLCASSERANTALLQTSRPCRGIGLPHYPIE